MFAQQIIVPQVSMTVQERSALLPQLTVLPVSSTMVLEQPVFQTLLIVLIHSMMDQEKNVSLTLKNASKVTLMMDLKNIVSTMSKNASRIISMMVQIPNASTQLMTALMDFSMMDQEKAVFLQQNSALMVSLMMDQDQNVLIQWPVA